MGCMNAFRVIECLQRMNILGGQNTESVKWKPQRKSGLTSYDPRLSRNGTDLGQTKPKAKQN